MDPRHLVQLATILEKGSLTQASRHLHLTQPTLTHNMQILEMQAGSQLFERSRYGVSSTPLGEMLAREGRAIAGHLKDSLEIAARHRQGMRGQIRLGTGPLIGAAIGAGFLAAALDRFPELSVTVRSDRPHALVEQLIDGQHDLVIAPSWLERPPAGLERSLLIDDRLGVFCGSSHPLAGRPPQTLAQGAADGQRWMSLGSASPFDRDVHEMLEQAGVRHPRFEVSAQGEALILLDALSQGNHLAVLPGFPLRRLMSRFGLVELPLPIQGKARPIYLWRRNDGRVAQGLTAIADLLRAQVAPSA